MSMFRLTLASLIVVSLFVVCCTLYPPATEPNQPIVYELPDGGGPATCETAAKHLANLGGCGLGLESFTELCRDAERATAGIDRRLPVKCMSSAPTCDAVKQCRVTAD